MNVTITPGPLAGTITPPPSKSQAHRLLIAAALAEGESVLTNVALSQDIEATLRCLAALGAGAVREGDSLRVEGLGGRRGSVSPCMCDAPHFDCGESGSTLRFLIPVALAAAGGGFFTGRGRLLARPQKPYEDLLREKGIFFSHKPDAISVRGELKAGVYALPGDVSSQFVTGLLYALPLLEGDSVIQLTCDLESRRYVDMTLQALERFGVEARADGPRRFRVPGGQRYRAGRARVEGDWSNAAFWYAANALGGRVDIRGLDPDSAQGDREIARFAALLARPGEAELDVSQCPDLVPPLAAMAALRPGQVTSLVGAARLRIKESDRLATVTATLNAMGARVEEHPDSLTIRGLEELAGGVTVDGCNDHRIAMLAAVAASRCAAPVTVTGAECVAKSYPNFWEDYEAMGGGLDRKGGAHP